MSLERKESPRDEEKKANIEKRAPGDSYSESWIQLFLKSAIHDFPVI